MRLSHRDFDALQGAILELYAHRDPKAFRQAAPDVLFRVIAADYLQLNAFTVDVATQQATLLELWESDPRMTEAITMRMMHRAPDHPFTQYSLETRDPTALKFTDFFSQRLFRESVFYHEFYRDLDLGRLLAVASSGTPDLWTINLGRRMGERDFTERDRLMLNLLRPHFDQARRNAERNTIHWPVGAQSLADYCLTPREAEVGRWLAGGKGNLEIAVILQMKVRTVEKHVERILIKLAVENRTAAAVIIAKSGGSA